MTQQIDVIKTRYRKPGWNCPTAPLTFQERSDRHDIGRKEHGFDRWSGLRDPLDRIGASLKARFRFHGKAGVFGQSEFMDAGEKALAAPSGAMIVIESQADEGDAAIAESAQMNGHRLGRIEVRIADTQIDRLFDEVADFDGRHANIRDESLGLTCMLGIVQDETAYALGEE